MEEESYKKEPFIKNLIINLLYMLLFLFLFMWIYPSPKVDLSDIKVNVDDTALKPLLNGVFSDNIERMKIAAKDYYTADRLPKNNGDKSSMSLDEMLSRKLLIPFVDEEGNKCNTKESYVQVTKNTNDYTLKVNLECNKKKDYIIDTIGCISTCAGSNITPEVVSTKVVKTAKNTNSVTYTNKNNGGSYNTYKYVETINTDYTDKNIVANDYSKKPIWNNTNNRTCYIGKSDCNISPSATDPYSGSSLSVVLIRGNINKNVAGTYVVTYETYTEHTVYDSITISVIVKDNRSYRKYISNYSKEYYNKDGYSGYLNLDSNSERKNYITYEWTNRVRYTYKCTNQGLSGTDGWTYLTTDTSDNHPTYYYSKNGFTGTLYKTNFYCKSGCSEKLIPELGTCYYLGQIKSIYRTWAGIYSGYVYSTTPRTYSGYVYLNS